MQGTSFSWYVPTKQGFRGFEVRGDILQCLRGKIVSKVAMMHASGYHRKNKIYHTIHLTIIIRYGLCSSLDRPARFTEDGIHASVIYIAWVECRRVQVWSFLLSPFTSPPTTWYFLFGRYAQMKMQEGVRSATSDILKLYPMSGRLTPPLGTGLLGGFSPLERGVGMMMAYEQNWFVKSSLSVILPAILRCSLWFVWFSVFSARSYYDFIYLDSDAFFDLGFSWLFYTVVWTIQFWVGEVS